MKAGVSSPKNSPIGDRSPIPERHREDLVDGVELEAFPRSVSVPLSGRRTADGRRDDRI